MPSERVCSCDRFQRGVLGICKGLRIELMNQYAGVRAIAFPNPRFRSLGSRLAASERFCVWPKDLAGNEWQAMVQAETGRPNPEGCIAAERVP